MGGWKVETCRPKGGRDGGSGESGQLSVGRGEGAGKRTEGTKLGLGRPVWAQGRTAIRAASHAAQRLGYVVVNGYEPAKTGSEPAACVQLARRGPAGALRSAKPHDGQHNPVHRSESAIRVSDPSQRSESAIRVSDPSQRSESAI